MLTPASVACADSTTATRSVNGLTCCNSVFRFGIGRRETAERLLDLGRCPLRQFAVSRFDIGLGPRLGRFDSCGFALAGRFFTELGRLALPGGFARHLARIISAMNSDNSPDIR